MKTKTFPKIIYITLDKDGSEYYLVPWEKLPDQDKEIVAEYELKHTGKVNVAVSVLFDK